MLLGTPYGQTRLRHLLLGGPHAAGFRELMTPPGFDMQVADERVGVASATKMCRSVMRCAP